MLPDWETNAVFVADLLADRHPSVLQELQQILSSQGVPLKQVEGSRDIWIRDAAPVQVSDGDFVQFRYRPDYLHGFEHLITGSKVFRKWDFSRKPRTSNIILDGGNVVGTAGTAILTEKVFRENPDRLRGEVEDELRRLLRVERLIFIPKEPYDPIGHVDGMVRFIDETTVIMNDYSAVDRTLGKCLRNTLEQHGLNIKLLPYQPERRRFDGIDSAVGNYANYLRIGELIIVPSYGIPEDRIARQRLARLCPTTVVSLPCLDLGREGGVLQCVTWTVQLAENEAN